MKLTVLIDNTPAGGLTAEWGLAVYIEYRDKKILLDTGASETFAANAAALGIDLSGVDSAVLSHAHYDHSDGMEAFFRENGTAVLHVRKSCAENCWGMHETGPEYIGIHRGWLKQYEDRISYEDGITELYPGVKLIPHMTEHLEVLGKKAGMFIRTDHGDEDEKFEHEQSLVFETSDGIVIFNSCCHGGADNIIREVSSLYPGRRVRALIGGLHLFRSSEEDVRRLAEGIRKTGIEKVVTGHCTGEAAMEILKSELPGVVEEMYCGCSLEIDD